ncbi:cytochrome P450 [Streptomyces sp. DH24]|uniref:cytochrome P450 n=1 Tax=Streptomyces sp. DH24 TaxID=3040123 RepID=UPI002442317A|nr:cytochrome P450 [Streptomyces sp. DH24]MDG9715507.1 cytochrome P450 [Streptomyces sp. DH24]
MTATDVQGDAARRVDFPFRRPGEPFPPPSYSAYREREGLVWSMMPGGQRVWLLTRFEDVREALLSPHLSSDSRNDGFPTPGRTGGPPSQTQIPGWFATLDPPEHERYRKVLMQPFTARRMKELRPRIQRVVEECVESLAAKGSPADLVADFAVPVPSLVICELLGVPRADRAFFESRIAVLVTLAATDEQRDRATTELLRYLGRMVTIKRRRPGDDLISTMIESGELTPMEVGGAALLLLIAGQETTANNIALGAVPLVSRPEWIGDEGIVDELLRFYSVADLVPLRVAVADVEIGGQLIRAGEGVAPLVAAANYDETRFGCPHAFDPGRSAQGHVAFGHGRHKCLGQHLVRVEMELAYRILFDRLPTLRLACPVEELPYKDDGVLYGLAALPVRW